jgi:hypothetical protein
MPNRSTTQPLNYRTTPPTIHLDHMKSKGVKLLNVGAEDITKGNHKIILALIWAVIQHYQLAAIAAEGVSGKDGLMLWCQRLTQGYEGVNVKNFTTSWASGLAFCAMLHKTNNAALDWDAVPKDDPAAALELAFRVAEEAYGIQPLLDLEDILEAPNGKPDDKIIMTYLWYVRRLLWLEHALSIHTTHSTHSKLNI